MVWMQSKYASQTAISRRKWAAHDQIHLLNDVTWCLLPNRHHSREWSGGAEAVHREQVWAGGEEGGHDDVPQAQSGWEEDRWHVGDAWQCQSSPCSARYGALGEHGGAAAWRVMFCWPFACCLFVMEEVVLFFCVVTLQLLFSVCMRV